MLRRVSPVVSLGATSSANSAERQHRSAFSLAPLPGHDEIGIPRRTFRYFVRDALAESFGYGIAIGNITVQRQRKCTTLSDGAR